MVTPSLFFCLPILAECLRNIPENFPRNFLNEAKASNDALKSMGVSGSHYLTSTGVLLKSTRVCALLE
jgi:hypothetical protein